MEQEGTGQPYPGADVSHGTTVEIFSVENWNSFVGRDACIVHVLRTIECPGCQGIRSLKGSV